MSLKARRMVKTLLRAFIIAVAVVAIFVYGFLSHRQKLPPYELLISAYDRALQIDFVQSLYYRVRGQSHPPGRWTRAEDGLSPSQHEEMEKLASLGYVSGTVTATGERGLITNYDKTRAEAGVNLYCSGHAPEVLLMDMEGKTLHRWRMNAVEAFPKDPPRPDDFRAGFFRRVHLYENGDLLAIYEGLGIVKIDKDSHLLWSNQNASHHAIYVDKSGEIYVLTRVPHIVPAVNERRPILEDFITVLGPDGVERRRYSVLEAVRNSDYSALMSYSKGYGDIFHTNWIALLDGGHERLSPHFKAGNALISLPELSTIAVVDLLANRVVWAMGGLFQFQHDPRLLENGDILLFDNRGRHGKSRVLELDPSTQEIRWTYPTAGTDHDFFSLFCGAAQRLSNGNTLITESEQGRAIEVTRENAIVWQFNSPHRAGDNKELVATLLEMQRLKTGFPLDWLTPKP